MAVAVRPAVVAVVQIGEAAALLPPVQAEQSAALVLFEVVVVVPVVVPVLVLVSAQENKSGFLVLHGSEPIIFHRFHH